MLQNFHQLVLVTLILTRTIEDALFNPLENNAPCVIEGLHLVSISKKVRRCGSSSLIVRQVDLCWKRDWVRITYGKERRRKGEASGARQEEYVSHTALPPPVLRRSISHQTSNTDDLENHLFWLKGVSNTYRYLF